METQTNPQTPIPGQNTIRVTPQETNNKKVPIWLIVLIGLGVAGFAVLALSVVANYLHVAGETNDAVKVSNQFVADIQSNNANAAYSLTTSAYRQHYSLTSLTQQIKQLSPVLQNKANISAKELYIWSNSSNHPNEAVTVYKIAAKTKSGFAYIRTGVEEGKPWQVGGFDISSSALADTLFNN
jgi:hypothetical protein